MGEGYPWSWLLENPEGLMAPLVLTVEGKGHYPGALLTPTCSREGQTLLVWDLLLPPQGKVWKHWIDWFGAHTQQCSGLTPVIAGGTISGDGN